MVDCGSFQGARAEADRKNRELGIDAGKVAGVVLTHGHLDHAGLLPLLVKRGFRGNIYATPASRDIANLIMMDSANIQARDAEWWRKQAKRMGTKFTWEPLYTETDAVQAAEQMVCVNYHRPILIGDGVSLEFFDAGHILGSAMAMLTINDAGREVKILCGGDLGRSEKPIIRVPETPPAPDYLILESTYGNRLHGSPQDALKKLGEIAKRAVACRGKIIIPSFAIERTQELVYFFHLLVDDGIIPPIPIYVDSPMATNATTIFQVHPECYSQAVHEAFIKHHKNPFGFNSLHFTTSVEESKALKNMKGPLVIISADGMCEAGRIVHHLANNIEDPNTTILCVGYMADQTLGRRIVEKRVDLKINGQWYKRRADVQKINAFSAHADYKEMGAWLDKLDTSRLKKIFMVHGEPDSQDFFKKYLADRGYGNVEIVEYGKTWEL
jgi:metallo-beta-lactamase family protein